MRMIRNSVAAATLVLLMTAGVRGHEGRQPWYQSIDIPGATLATAQGVNGRRDVVGWYVNASGTHGYLLRQGTITTIDYPGAVYTDARGINNHREIVGAYRMPGEPAVNFHGYRRTRYGEFIPIDFPGHTNTIPQRITDAGLVLGCRHDGDTMGTMHGIEINSNNISEATDISLPASMNNGIMPDGSVGVGLYTDMAGSGHAYLLYGNSILPFDVPGSTFTAGWDINPEGDVVGAYRDAGNKFHGFRWADLRFASIDFPGAGATRAFGINWWGDIVGAYVDTANRTHGFIVRDGDGDRDDHDR